VSGLTSSDRPAASTGSGGDAGGGNVGPATSRLVSVRAHRSATVKITAPRGSHWGAGFAVVLTPLPGSGPVYAGQVLASKSGTVLGIMPVASALTRVSLSPVRDSLTTSAPRP
jgi:hypothetical protein